MQCKNHSCPTMCYSPIQQQMFWSPLAQRQQDHKPGIFAIESRAEWFISSLLTQDYSCALQIQRTVYSIVFSLRLPWKYKLNFCWRIYDNNAAILSSSYISWMLIWLLQISYAGKRCANRFKLQWYIQAFSVWSAGKNVTSTCEDVGMLANKMDGAYEGCT